MTPEDEAKIDCSLCTWKGSRRSQHQDFYSLSFRRKMEVIEEMNELAESFLDSRKRRGLPYIDPVIGRWCLGRDHAKVQPPGVPRKIRQKGPK